MARDYKHSARKSRKPPPTPAWMWLTSGFIAGLGVALGVHLYHLSTPAETAPTPRSAAVPASEAAEDEQAMRSSGDAEPEEEYSFYETLKKTVVRVPDDTEAGEPVRPPPTGVPSKLSPGPSQPIRSARAREGAGNEPKPSGAAPAAATPPGGYLVQTGAFRDSTEAEAMRASLGLLGLTSSIQRAVDGNDRIWHRVHVPAPDERELARVQSLLERENIAMMVIANNE